MTTVAVIIPTNLGADFDQGTQTTGKINVVSASTTTPGKVRLATGADVTAVTAGAAIDAAMIVQILSSGTILGGLLRAGLPTTEPSQSGVAWLNGGVLQVS